VYKYYSTFRVKLKRRKLCCEELTEIFLLFLVGKCGEKIDIVKKQRCISKMSKKCTKNAFEVLKYVFF